MGAEKDFQHCRKMVDDAVRQASDTRTLLIRIQDHQQHASTAAEKNNRRLMYNKLSDNLAITARVLEDVVRRFTAEERKRMTFSQDEIDLPPSTSTSTGDAASGPTEYRGGLLEDFDREMMQEKTTSLIRVGVDIERGRDEIQRYTERRSKRKLWAATGGVGLTL